MDTIYEPVKLIADPLQYQYFKHYQSETYMRIIVLVLLFVDVAGQFPYLWSECLLINTILVVGMAGQFSSVREVTSQEASLSNLCLS
jgi:hypothetical protein